MVVPRNLVRCLSLSRFVSTIPSRTTTFATFAYTTFVLTAFATARICGAIPALELSVRRCIFRRCLGGRFVLSGDGGVIDLS